MSEDKEAGIRVHAVLVATASTTTSHPMSALTELQQVFKYLTSRHNKARSLWILSTCLSVLCFHHFIFRLRKYKDGFIVLFCAMLSRMNMCRLRLIM